MARMSNHTSYYPFELPQDTAHVHAQGSALPTHLQMATEHDYEAFCLDNSVDLWLVVSWRVVYPRSPSALAAAEKSPL